MEENTTLKSIGERIRIARKAKGLNQQQLADAIGKSIRAVQMYEKGETDLNISIMESLATALDMKLSDLISDNKSENLATLSDVIEFFIQLSKVKNVLSSMAVEDMYFSNDFIEKMIKVAKGELSSEELRKEVLKQYGR